MKKYYAAHKPYYRIFRLHLFYRLLASSIDHFYSDYDIRYDVKPVEGESNIFISNHCKLHGPIAFRVKLGRPKLSIWGTWELCYFRRTPKYMMADFFFAKPKWSRPFYWLVSFVMTPVFVFAIRGAQVIPVFRDHRLITTYRKTQEQMEAGNEIVIFPESPKPHSTYVNEFNEGFSDVATMIYRRTKKIMHFYPTYLCPDLRILLVGQPIAFNPELHYKQQRKVINEYCMNEIDRLASTLPPHRVINFY